MPRNLKNEIIEQVERLGVPEQQKVLDFAKDVGLSAGTPGRDLLSFAGSIDPQDLQIISQTIQDGCEKVEPDGW